MSLEPFHVILIGSGEVMFGSPEGPWNHSLRLERALGKRLNVTAIIDPDTARANQRKEEKLSLSIPGYEHAQICSSPSEVSQRTVDLIIIGVPPHFRGSTTQDLELRLLKHFDSKRWLIEKPISAQRPGSGQEDVATAFADSRKIVGVGYMLRALKAVTIIKGLIRDKGLRVMSTQARFYMAYEWARKPAWWNSTISCGPIVEQATHLLSLSLLFGGSADLESVRTHTVEHSDPPGELSALRFDENVVPSEDRIPRCTNSVWRYETGAIGSLVHAVTLHETTYDTEFEVLCDGYTFKLTDVYTSAPKLYMRQSGKEGIEEQVFEGDDPFQTQIDDIIANKPACSFADALETYELSWAIRLAGEKERGK